MKFSPLTLVDLGENRVGLAGALQCRPAVDATLVQQRDRARATMSPAYAIVRPVGTWPNTQRRLVAMRVSINTATLRSKPRYWMLKAFRPPPTFCRAALGLTR